MNILQVLCSKLFGWKYVAFEFGWMGHKVRRIRYPASGDKYAVCKGKFIRPKHTYDWFEL